MSANQETLALEGAHTADQIRSYVLRSDAIVACCVLDVHVIQQALKDIEAYWLGNVPCRNVRLVGILISVAEYESRSIYSIDDGTASINCIHKRSVRLSSEHVVGESSFHHSRGYNPGDTVSVVGKIETYKGSVHQASAESCSSPDAESRHLLNVLEQHRTVYSQPFVIPPLPAPATPRKHGRPNSQLDCPSMASTPTTASHSSPISSPQKKDSTRLRHPSRLRSKDLNENVFRMYLSYVAISTLSVPEPAPKDIPPDSVSDSVENSTPKISRTLISANVSDKTPRRPSRPLADPFGSPTPRKSVAQPLVIADASSTPTLGVTLSYLRRVRVLAELAMRVVDQAAHERDKVLRHAERNARSKYEALQSLSSEHQPPRSTGTRSISPGLASSSHHHHKSSRPSQVITSSKRSEGGPDTGVKSSHPRHSMTTDKHNTSRSSRVSSASHKSSSRAKSQPAFPPEETTRRAAYHAMQSKLHAEDKQKRATRTKRLFESALRTLVKEGELIVYDGPRRQIPASDKTAGRSMFTLSGIWPDVTNTTTSSGVSYSVVSSISSGPSCFDLGISEDNDEALSDPSDSEDAYIPVTPQTLRPVMLSALRRTLMRHRGGVDLDTWMRTLRGDGQWAQVSDLVVKETLEVLRQEEWVAKVGGGRWDFTRGSWARSLKFN
ncbi:hypothetical protein CTheo_4174 [Ceratobasidium theobromae]|uniref:CST complex subunit Stn1 N-terminal domain-containing protein n=1 Tax=Ceratobasidium theobromae TaxID=1582974 RepID=A0A5N5QKT0_9AGAM|nr:hypothetical protein CTheo_4174 [Ceratobasidium theobromae]